MSYDLDEGTVRRLVATALAAYPTATGRFLALAVGPATPLADVARTVERQVFDETFELDAATMTTEYRRYESDSLFFIVLDRKTGLPAGAARMIDGGGKTLDDAPDLIDVPLSTIVALHRMYSGRIWDFATVAVLPAYRENRAGLTVSSLLYRTFLNAGRRAGVEHMVTMLDRRAHRNLRMIGVEFSAMAGSAPFAYLGSASTQALYVPFEDLQPSIARQSQQLGRIGSGHAGEIVGGALRRLLTRRTAARVAAQIASGYGLDEHIMLPALDRRRLVRQS
jgi:N-acyl-L-homoserine lactone synthetase